MRLQVEQRQISALPQLGQGKRTASPASAISRLHELQAAITTNSTSEF